MEQPVESPLRILLAEDDRAMHKVLVPALAEKGWEIISAFTGTEAWDLITKQHPDLVLLDIMMPGKNGFQLLKDLRDHNELSRIPVVIISNLGLDQDIRRGLSLGAKGYIVKANFSLDEMVTEIERYVAKIKK